jgi:hypothetical protein
VKNEKSIRIFTNEEQSGDFFDFIVSNNKLIIEFSTFDRESGERTEDRLFESDKKDAKDILEFLKYALCET